MSSRTLYSGAYLRMCLANAFLCTYIFANFTLQIRFHHDSVSFCLGSMALFTVGLFLPGVLNAYMMERFKRKGIYIKSVLVILSLNAVFAYSTSSMWLLLAFLLQGMAFSTAQNALGNTLVNDLLVSEKRTLGDNLYSWYGRLGLPAGWAMTILLVRYVHSPVAQIVWFAAIPCVFALLLVLFQPIPLKAPVRTTLFSTDRFWHSKAVPLFLATLLAAAIEGLMVGGAIMMDQQILLKQPLYMGVGFLLALWLQRVAFLNAENRAEMIAGALLTLAATILSVHPLQAVRTDVAFCLLGAGIGMISARLLMYFLKLSGHCQRGTAQNTYMLGWRTGFSLGFLLAVCCMKNVQLLASIAGGSSIVLCVAYLWYIHPWFDRHKDRSFKFCEGV